MNAHIDTDTQAVFMLKEGRFGGAEARAEGFCTEQDGRYPVGDDIEDATDYRRGPDG